MKHIKHILIPLAVISKIGATDVIGRAIGGASETQGLPQVMGAPVPPGTHNAARNKMYQASVRSRLTMGPNLFKGQMKYAQISWTPGNSYSWVLGRITPAEGFAHVKPIVDNQCTKAPGGKMTGHFVFSVNEADVEALYNLIESRLNNPFGSDLCLHNSFHGGNLDDSLIRYQCHHYWCQEIVNSVFGRLLTELHQAGLAFAPINIQPTATRRDGLYYPENYVRYELNKFIMRKDGGTPGRILVIGKDKLEVFVDLVQIPHAPVEEHRAPPGLLPRLCQAASQAFRGEPGPSSASRNWLEVEA